MKWVTNALDPDGNSRPPKGSEELEQLLDIVSRHTKGPPKASDVFTVERLEAGGLIGLYKPEPE